MPSPLSDTSQERRDSDSLSGQGRVAPLQAPPLPTAGGLPARFLPDSPSHSLNLLECEPHKIVMFDQVGPRQILFPRGFARRLTGLPFRSYFAESRLMHCHFELLLRNIRHLCVSTQIKTVRHGFFLSRSPFDISHREHSRCKVRAVLTSALAVCTMIAIVAIAVPPSSQSPFPFSWWAS